MNPNLSQLSSITSTSSMTSNTNMSYLFDGNTYIYGGTFNFSNPQSSQKRQSDDSGLQIAKTKYKRILPLVIPILNELFSPFVFRYNPLDLHI